MSELSYPTPCESCKKLLYGPVSYCPYCATPREARSTSQTRSTPVIPQTSIDNHPASVVHSQSSPSTVEKQAEKETVKPAEPVEVKPEHEKAKHTYISTGGFAGHHEPKNSRPDSYSEPVSFLEGKKSYLLFIAVPLAIVLLVIAYNRFSTPSKTSPQNPVISETAMPADKNISSKESKAITDTATAKPLKPASVERPNILKRTWQWTGEILNITWNSLRSKGSSGLKGKDIVPNAVVKSNNTNVRSDATTSGKVICTLESGTQIEVGEEKDGWSKIRCKSGNNIVTGWIRSTLIRSSKAVVSEAVTSKVRPVISSVEVKSESANIYSGKSADSRILARVSKGGNYKYLEEDGLWVKIQLSEGKNGTTGWIKKHAVIVK